VGSQNQDPPDYSAVKMKGKKAYQLARKGFEVSLKPRKVTIYSIKLVSYEFPILKIITKVSSGTYIRSLARDIGKKLELGAYLKNLKRTKIGKYKIVNAVELERLTSINWRDFVFLL
jgi:tRNA pseudouridine55 synthase